MKRALAVFIFTFLIAGHGGSAWAFDITGTWTIQDGSKAYIRQIGNEIYFYTEPAPVNPFGASVAYGTISGSIIRMKWADVPKGRNRNDGTYVFEVVSDDVIVLNERTGNTGIAQLTRDNGISTKNSPLIKITDARYGRNSKYCDATGFARSSCDGKTRCQFTAANNICGDPISGVIKEILVRYSCGYPPERNTRADEHSTLSISCE